ncbi:MAG TPA: flagellar biosynthesis protein FliQ [Acidimicrobiales bacterium]|nr:flagellar biosynthesis protein FliQ [Acidimicrobiales bacterium]
MNDQGVLQLAGHALTTAGELAAPVLLTSLVVGLLVSLFQSVTQIQEFTLSFVPKLLAISAVLMFSGHWMISTMVSFTQSTFQMLPRLLNGG